MVRVEFKILCIVFKLLYHQWSAPYYLSELISVFHPIIHTKSCSGVKLLHPKLKSKLTKAYGDRAFSNYAPVLWNRLPGDMRAIGDLNVFKQNLKTSF